jgi:thiamine biosynthesis lipoprotein ApbE
VGLDLGRCRRERGGHGVGRGHRSSSHGIDPDLSLNESHDHDDVGAGCAALGQARQPAAVADRCRPPPPPCREAQHLPAVVGVRWRSKPNRHDRINPEHSWYARGTPQQSPQRVETDAQAEAVRVSAGRQQSARSAPHAACSADHASGGRFLGVVMSATAVLSDLEGHSATWSALGCVVRLVVTDPDVLDGAARELAGELAAIDEACSRFRVDSELMRLQAARGKPVKVSPLFGAALAVALRAAEVTDGLLDPTLAGMIAAFGYDRDFDELPADGPAPVEAPPSPSRWREIRLSGDRRSVVVPSGVQLDLGATAKALAADRAARRLADASGCGVLVGLGGDIAVVGPAPVGGWSVRVQESPGALEAEPAGAASLISLVDGALATSSVQHRKWRRGGRSYHHIVDPRTGRPASSPWRTVSVAAASCVDANIASTAAIVMGEPAPDWLNDLGLPARLVRTDGDVLLLNGWPDAER